VCEGEVTVNQHPKLLLTYWHSQIPCHSVCKRKKRGEAIMASADGTVRHRFLSACS